MKTHATWLCFISIYLKKLTLCLKTLQRWKFVKEIIPVLNRSFLVFWSYKIYFLFLVCSECVLTILFWELLRDMWNKIDMYWFSSEYRSKIKKDWWMAFYEALKIGLTRKIPWLWLAAIFPLKGSLVEASCATQMIPFVCRGGLKQEIMIWAMACMFHPSNRR